jgi:hypothetical protein
MASSLLFRIASVFDSTGFREAAGSFASTLGWVGKLSVGIAKFAVQGKILGRIFGLLIAADIAKAGFGLLKFLVQAAPAAGRAEVTFSRMRTQLGLIGKSSKENISLVTQFADTASRKTRFSAEQIQSAVTVAARRTGDLRLALKQVSVAQDFAAATGMDLVTATNILNRAQAGYTRILTQVTDLRQADIQQAVRQGTLMDLLAKKFKGAASNELSTYAGKLQLLQNVQKQTQESIGAFGLPILKLIADVKILGATFVLDLVQGLHKASKGLANYSGELVYTSDATKKVLLASTGLSSFIALLTRMATGVQDVQKALSPGKEFTFNFDKELELATLRLGKTRDERQQMARDLAKIEDLLVVAEGDGVDVLSKEQIALIQSYQWSTRELQTLLSDRVTATKKAAKAVFDAQRERESGANDKKGFLGQVKGALDLVKAAQQANVPVRQLATELSKSYGISQNLANMLAQIGVNYSSLFSGVDIALDSIKTKMADISGMSDLSKVKALYGAMGAEIETAIKAQVQPKFNVQIDFNLPPEAIQTAVRNAVITGLPSIIASLFRNNAVTASKENKAAAPLV